MVKYYYYLPMNMKWFTAMFVLLFLVQPKQIWCGEAHRVAAGSAPQFCLHVVGTLTQWAPHRGWLSSLGQQHCRWRRAADGSDDCLETSELLSAELLLPLWPDDVHHQHLQLSAADTSGNTFLDFHFWWHHVFVGKHSRGVKSNPQLKTDPPPPSFTTTNERHSTTFLRELNQKFEIVRNTCTSPPKVTKWSGENWQLSFLHPNTSDLRSRACAGRLSAPQLTLTSVWFPPGAVCRSTLFRESFLPLCCYSLE